jgi:hypothetical protein
MPFSLSLGGLICVYAGNVMKIRRQQPSRKTLIMIKPLIFRILPTASKLYPIRVLKAMFGPEKVGQQPASL